MPDGFHLDLENVPKDKLQDALKAASRQPSEQELAEQEVVKRAVNPDEVSSYHPLVVYVLSAVFGSSSNYALSVKGQTRGLQGYSPAFVNCDTVLTVDDTKTKTIMVPREIPLRAGDLIRASLVPVERVYLSKVLEGKNVFDDGEREGGKINFSVPFVYVPREPAETELAVLIERLDETTMEIKETYHSAGIHSLFSRQSGFVSFAPTRLDGLRKS